MLPNLPKKRAAVMISGGILISIVAGLGAYALAGLGAVAMAAAVSLVAGLVALAAAVPCTLSRKTLFWIWKLTFAWTLAATMTGAWAMNPGEDGPLSALTGQLAYYISAAGVCMIASGVKTLKQPSAP